MGGESFQFPISSTEEVSSAGQDYSLESIKAGFSSGEEVLSAKLENGSVINGESGLQFVEFSDVDFRISSNFEAAERQRCKVYAEVLRSYEELQCRIERLEEAKSKILSYTPGSWVENVGSIGFDEYNVPKITSLLLIGLKGSGKSSLVNKISRVLEDGIFASERAQVSFSSSTGEGTYFLQEYVIPRDSGSFCLYDTRGLSADSVENVKMLKRWMTKGVRHGELVKRESDSLDLKARLKCKARQNTCSSQVRAINFVVFVVNGLAILESIDGDDEMKNRCIQMIATTFNNPLLSFKDDKPLIVVTHGDLLSLSDRARVRVHLGEMLGVHPAKQIFDIPDSKDSTTTLTIVDMLYYCLERADRNLPGKDHQYMNKICMPSLTACLILLVALGIAIVFQMHDSNVSRTRATTASSQIDMDWHKIRHLWLGSDNYPNDSC